MELDKIVCMDALDYLRGLGDASVDMVLTDPPFNVHEAEWDKAIDISAYWAEFIRVIKPQGAVVIHCVMSFGWKLIAANPTWFKYDLVTIKSKPTDHYNAHNKPLRGHENILVFSSGTTANKSLHRMVYNPQNIGGSSYFDSRKPGRGRWTFGGKGRTHSDEPRNKQYTGRFLSTILSQKVLDTVGNQHPNQKDIQLALILTKMYSNPGDIVLDPFMGSGTTALAAKLTGRHYIGCDLSQQYVDIANARLADMPQDKTLQNGDVQLSLFGD